jgi:hypothetical protein
MAHMAASLTAAGSLSYAAPGMGLTTTAVPRETVAASIGLPQVTRHTVAAEEVEEGMVGTMQELRVAVVDRNADLEAELAAIRERHAHLKAAVDEEVAACADTFAAIRARMDAAFTDLDAELRGRGSAAATAAAAAFPPMHEKLDGALREETRFYTEDIPARNEAMVRGRWGRRGGGRRLQTWVMLHGCAAAHGRHHALG